MIRRRWSVAALAVLTAGGCAQEKTATAAWQLLLARHDENGDEVITRAEYSRGARAFARLDRDRDGELTRADVVVARDPKSRTPPRGMRAEILGPLARAADANEDGQLERQEWSAWLKRVAASGGLARSDLTLLGAEAQRGDMLVAMLDDDADDALSIAETRAAFARLDFDGDETLRGDELGPPLPTKAPKVGEPAPDFELPTLADPKITSKLSSLAAERPVALIFGSYT